MKETIDSLLCEVKKRYESLPENKEIRNSYIRHLNSLARWYDEPMDYPEVKKVKFPKVIFISYAVCHPECGAREFLVDGSTQRCQKCGGLLFRTEVKKYVLDEEA
jgi:hypothetical protein